MEAVFAVITGPELLVIGVVIVLLFGAQQLPKLARAMGHAKKEYEAGLQTPAEPASRTQSTPAPKESTSGEQPPAGMTS